MPGPLTIIAPEDMQTKVETWRSDGLRVGFVPTMGALHAGHLSLVKNIKQHCDRVVVSIFVNPTQFGPNEDFAQYPRTLKEDRSQLHAAAVDAIYLPNTNSMYPEGFQTYVVNTGMSQTLCGASRPNHYQGVLTVVLKLFRQIQPHVAVFGKKDYQQWRLIETMTRDLCLGVEVLGSEIVREEDGLAMSSRNRYLDSDQRSQATHLHAGLLAAKAEFLSGARETEILAAKFRDVVVKNAPNFELEYCAVRRANDLMEFDTTVDDQNVVMLVAGKFGNTRLIDNMELV